MSSESFARHTRACVDAAVHRVFATHRSAFFERLLAVVRARSDLMRQPPVRGEVVQVAVLAAILPFEYALVREPETWAGARGHPLAVVDSLANHLFGRYPVPRFLASAWFGRRAVSRAWYVAHAQGQRFRTLDVPVALTRQMEHVFLHTPDHYPVEHALRRAEVIGLGGSPELADVVLATRIGECFDDPERWRLALAWLARCGDTVELTQVGPLVDYLVVNDIKLRGRTFASVMRLVREWHGLLGLDRVPLRRWRPSKWSPLVVPIAPTPTQPRHAEWTLRELLDSRELAYEGRTMNHCVATYWYDCVYCGISIWSLRQRRSDEHIGRSVLTIEVNKRIGMIVQIRGKANSAPKGWALELVRTWAVREGLRFHPRLDLAKGVMRAA